MIVIPMAGLSSRFLKAGYAKPKFMLKAHDETLFAHSLKSFKAYFSTELFLFILNKKHNAKHFVIDECQKLRITDFQIVELEHDTRGQADTVMLGLLELTDKGLHFIEKPITIFNIDTFRPDFVYPELDSVGAGYLEVFRGEGNNWSYVRPEGEGGTTITETAEKRPISDLCCTGLYHFTSATLFIKAFQKYLELPEAEWEKGELYIAPIYNMLLKDGYDIHYNLIASSEVIFCGTPNEYSEFLLR